MSAEKHRDRWLESQSAEDLRKWIRKGSCLCDMAGLCSACRLADLEHQVRTIAKTADVLPPGSIELGRLIK